MSVGRGFRLKDATDCLVVVRDPTLTRLDSTCFRGRHLRCAGNFHRWGRANEFLDDPRVREEILGILEEVHAEGFAGTESFSIDYGSTVGWTSTAPLENYNQDDLEDFKPNRKSKALRVRLGSPHFAPQTQLVTLIFQFLLEGQKRVSILHSIYPGEDIGELCGNVTEREKVVFFGWSHPGA